MTIKNTIEAAVNIEGDFNMVNLANNVWSMIEAIQEVSSVLPEIKEQLGSANMTKLARSIIRNAFLIELVKVPKIETTKFRVRWYEQLNDDPRYCSFDECLQIAINLLVSLPDWLDSALHKESMLLSFSNGMIPYESPLDYLERISIDGRTHKLDNLVWVYDELVLRTLRIRKYLTDPSTSPDSKFFRAVLSDKIKVKTYLTDRVLTGEHKTNREKRWETHPDSVHFAQRNVCIAIEYRLATQICAFNGFPKSSLLNLQQAGILPQTLPVALCPITGDMLSYDAFRDQLLNPTHGKSDFQVGHLNPLKLGDDEMEAAGHTASNISWISADGNRIQGSMSLNDVRHLIQRISKNYDQQNWWLD